MKKKSKTRAVNIPEDCYDADSPLTDPALDGFKRWPFAQGIAKRIASRRDPSSIVMGIYGKWGEGKTTVLNFIKKELNSYSNIVPVSFNPWRFVDEILMLRSFFQTLADEIGKSISSKKEKIGEWLQKYAAIIAPITVTVGGVVELNAAESIKGLGQTLSSVELDTLKSRIETRLQEGEKRVVVLIDDIDRLDKTEIQAIFKLVKLTAGFKYISYILAFDDEMVAAALDEKYSPGNDSTKNKKGGYSFLEKIVQVQLHMPKADIISLRNYCFKAVDKALKGAEIELTEAQIRAFVRHFIDGIEIRLQTPRMVKRYENALASVLPLLKKEVHPVDLLLLQGISVFYPELYEIMRENPDAFLPDASLGTDLVGSRHDDQIRKRSADIIDEGLKELNNDEKNAAKYLLKVLFPRLGGMFGNARYGPEWDKTWAEEQRIASKCYLIRCFSYTVPDGDVSDQELESFIDKIEKGSIDDVVSELKRLVTERNAGRFILKLRRKEEILTPAVSQHLALAVARVSYSFPDPETSDRLATPFSQAAMFVSRLVETIPRGKERFGLAKSVVQQAEPISFACECLIWMRTTEKKEDQDRTLAINEEDELGKIVAGRIKKFSEGKVIYKLFPEKIRRILYVWSKWGAKEEPGQYLARTFDKDPHNAIELLKCFLPTAWEMETGLSHKSDFERDQYDSIKEVIQPEIVYGALIRVYGAGLDPQEYPTDNGKLSLDERTARQFAYLYKNIKTNEANKSGK